MKDEGRDPKERACTAVDVIPSEARNLQACQRAAPPASRPTANGPAPPPMSFRAKRGICKPNRKDSRLA